MARKKVKKRKIKLKNVLVFVIIILIIIAIFLYLNTLNINRITVSKSSIYEEWEIIKKAGLDNYPKTLKHSSNSIKASLEKDPYIKEAKVTKKFLTEVNIEITDNLPLFYYVPERKTILADKTKTDDNFPVPTVINYIPDKIYSEFLKSLEATDYTIIKRVSEIKYDPNDVDEERFLLTMNDGNYVYLTLSKFKKINSYLDIIKEFDNKKGILYLDSGEYFEILG